MGDVFFQIIALATNIFLQLKDKTAKDDYTDAGFIVGLSMVQLTISPRVSWLYDSIWLGVGWAWIVLVRFVMITACSS